MNKKTYFFLLLIAAANSAWAGGFKMGLGNAAAETATGAFEKAAEIDLKNNVGDNVASSLESCGNSALYTVSPIVTPDIQGIDPLGHVNGYGHTFPTDHIYFYLQPLSTSAPSGTRVTTNVLAPADIHITAITSAMYNGNPSNVDYGMEFYSCREVKSYFSHVRNLTQTILDKLNSTDQRCMDYGSGGSNIHRCEALVNIPVSAGDVVGTIGGQTASLDFGTYDYRRSPIPFISPSRHYANRLFTVCPIDYYVSAVKATLEPMFGRWDGGHQRTDLPLCGEINFDVAGTASGLWYKIGSADMPEDPHLALIEDNVYSPRQSISMGTSVPGITSAFYPFDPLTSGTYNRDFTQVTSDGQVYCYDSFFDPVGVPSGAGLAILISMPTSTTIRVGKYGTGGCGAGPWTFTTYADFQR